MALESKPIKSFCDAR